MFQKKSLVLVLCLFVVFMFGFGFALVPIYNSLCKSLGINGKADFAAQATTLSQELDLKREIRVEFVANQSSTVAWKFYPSIHTLKIHPGGLYKLSFYAENLTDHEMTVQAIPSITPGLAAKYLKKTECFCFTQQVLAAHEAMYMPLIFHVDTDLPSTIKTITLSYTLFDISNRL